MAVQKDVGRLDITVHYAKSVGKGKRGTDLIEETHYLLPGPEPALKRSLQATTTNIVRHKIGTFLISPIVVERNDMWVLQPCHVLRLRCEATDELWMVGILRQDDLDRN